MRISNIVKGISLTLALAVCFASGKANAGEYYPVSATAPQLLTINGTKYMCFSVYMPTWAQYEWCMPASDPASIIAGQAVASAMVKGKAVDVGCNNCVSIAGDSRDPGTKWIPEWVFVIESSGRVQ